MSKSCPSSFLESQTIAARSWVLASAENKHEDLNVDVCNDDCCQRYQGVKGLNESAISSANKTRGYILTSNIKFVTPDILNLVVEYRRIMKLFGSINQ